MEKGKFIPLSQAKAMVRAFIDREIIRTNRDDEKKLIIGHFFDLNKMEELMAGIKNLNDSNPGSVNGVTIYMGISENPLRGINKDDTDVILVPSKDQEDIYNIYEQIESLGNDLILADSLPCPNVCPTGGKNVNCNE